MMGGSNTNLVTTIIGFGLSATFIVFVCTKIICGRLHRHVASRTIYEFDSRADIERPEHHVNGTEPAVVAAIPTLKFNQDSFSSIEYTQCVICLADYKDQELLRIIPKCGHSFHLSCIDMWLRKQSTCPVCRLPLQNALQTKHNVTTVTLFTINQSLHHHDHDDSNSSERNIVVMSPHESNSSSNPLPSSSQVPEARQ